MSSPASAAKAGLVELSSVEAAEEASPKGMPATPPVGAGPAASPNSRENTRSGIFEKSSRIDMRYLIHALIKYHASDLHIRVGRPPLYRINGKIVPTRMDELTQSQAETIIHGVLSEKQILELQEKRTVDLSFRMKDFGRFRCNVFFQRGTIGAAIRMIPLTVPTFDSLGIPPVLKELCKRPRGLLLVTGATGSGKSTTMASLLQYINETSYLHLLAIEDPIEFVYRDNKATVTQREVGSDTPSLEAGLHAGLRQDPDVIMIGELRDYRTIQAALTAAETGHLVISTLHTNDSKSTIQRILDVFPGESKNQVRIQLASSLVGVVTQQLLLRADGNGRVPACEVMVTSPAIHEYILKNDLEQIPATIANSSSYYQMQTMNQALERLVKSKMITGEVALKVSSNPDDLKMRLAGIAREEGYEMAGSGGSAEKFEIER